MLCNSCQCSKFKFCFFGTFWTFFFLSIFDPHLVESADVEPAGAEGRLYILLTQGKHIFVSKAGFNFWKVLPILAAGEHC